MLALGPVCTFYVRLLNPVDRPSIKAAPAASWPRRRVLTWMSMALRSYSLSVVLLPGFRALGAQRSGLTRRWHVDVDGSAGHGIAEIPALVKGASAQDGVWCAATEFESLGPNNTDVDGAGRARRDTLTEGVSDIRGAWLVRSDHD